MRSVIERNPPPPENCGEGVDFSLFDIPTAGGGRRSTIRSAVPVSMRLPSQEPNSGVNALDPNFKIPKTWKFNLGTTWTFGDDYMVNGDLLYTKAEDSAIVIGSTHGADRHGAGWAADLHRFARFNSDYILTNVTGQDAAFLPGQHQPVQVLRQRLRLVGRLCLHRFQGRQPDDQFGGVLQLRQHLGG